MKILQAIFQKDFNPDNYMHPKGQAPASTFKDAFEKFQEHTKSNQDAVTDLGYTELVIPGRIIHLQRLSKSATTQQTQQAQLRTPSQDPSTSTISGVSSAANPNPNPNPSSCWDRLRHDWLTPSVKYAPTVGHVNNFKDLALSPSMAWEHLPDQYMNHLEALHRAWNP